MTRATRPGLDDVRQDGPARIAGGAPVPCEDRKAILVYAAREPAVVIPREPRPLAPHIPKPLVQPLKPRAVPTILLSYAAYCDTMHLIAEAGTAELSWLGSVQELGPDRYLIDKVLLFPQQVNVNECLLDPGALGSFVASLLRRGRRNRTFVESLRFWGHLHPLDTEPSETDERQMEIFAETPWFVRGIFTRLGRAEFTFFDYRQKMKVTDCPWSIALKDAGRRRALAAQIRKKVTQLPLQRKVDHDTHDTTHASAGSPESAGPR